MTSYLTLRDRKKSRASIMRRDFTVLCDRLREYASAKGGRFIVYGSAARDALRFDSDVDVLVDFQESDCGAAWHFVETEYRRLGLTPDVRPVSYCEPQFVAEVIESGMVLR